MESSFNRQRVGRTATWRLIGMFAVVTTWLTVPAATAAAGEIEIVAGQDLSVVLATAQDTGEIGIAISNLSRAEGTYAVTYVVPGKTDSEIDSIVGLLPSSVTVPARSTTPVVVTFQRKKLSGPLAGFVVVTGSGSTAAVPVRVATGVEQDPNLPMLLVVFALIVGVSLALYRASTVPNIRQRWSLPIGNIGWSFSDSWATNLTAIGAILGTVASIGLLPKEPMLLSKEAYAGLSVFFGIMVVLAPFLFVATAKLGLSAGKQQRDGYAKWFVVSAAFTVAAVVGQLLTLAVLLIDGFLRGTAIFLIGIVAAVVLVGGLFVLVHAWRTIPWTIETFARVPPDAGQEQDAAEEVATISLL